MKECKICKRIGGKHFASCPKLQENRAVASDPVAETRLSPAVSCWVAFDWNKIETRPTEYGKYLICRKDGKIHWETWNGSGWAYNHNEIRFWAVIVPPCL